MEKYWGSLLVLFVLLVMSTYWSCKPESPEQQEVDTHRNMLGTLDSIAVHSDPHLNYHMNLAMAEIYHEQLENVTDPQQRINLFIAYTQQLLNGGNTEQAIRNLENIKEQLIAQGFSLEPAVKPIYDLMAVAYLRLGEEQNCVANHTSASCIVPLQQDGWHDLTEGSSKAIEMYEQILTEFPNDLNSRYLLNIAYMTLGKYPDEVPEIWLLPLDEKPEIDFPFFKEVAIDLDLDVLGLSGGVCVADFNNNGYLDIFMTSYGLKDQCRLFVNNGDGSFTDATLSAGLDGIVSGLNAVHADYNNSGYTDILILRGAWLGEGGGHPNSLLRNNGDGTFTDVTEKAGLLSFHPTQTASWADFDGDGYLDLYIGNESQTAAGIAHPNELYRNNGDGTFTNIAPQLGLDLTVFSKGVVWGDINNNGMPDLYVSVMGEPNRLFVNRGGSDFSNWQFEEMAAEAGLSQPVFSFPVAFLDFDNDGYQDLLVMDYNSTRLEQVAEDYSRELLGQPPAGETMKLFRNLGNEKFEDVTHEVGLDKITYAMGFNFGDLNNNGYLDFYVGTGAPDFRSIVPNRMFKNVSGQSFQEVTYFGFGHIQKGHGIAFADFDNDGDQDIYAVQGGAFEGDVAFNLLFENPLEESNWVHIVTEGVQSNRSGIGARIKVEVENEEGEVREIYRVVNSGGTFGGNPLRTEIGLGDAAKINEIVVEWPHQTTVDVFQNPPLNQILEIQEGRSEPEVINTASFSLSSSEAE